MSSKGEVFIIAIYVDDILLAGKSNEHVTQVKVALAEKFAVKDMGELSYFLEVNIKQNTNGEIWIGQPVYTEKVLQKYGMENSKPVSTPVEVSSKLVKATEESELVDQGLYQSIVGSLLYLSTMTRPDINFAVCNVAKFTSEPTKHHLTAVKRILRYLRGTINYGLLYTKDGSNECIGYSDADWAGDVNDRKSTSGYLFQVSGAAVSWKSKKQTCVALSTAEAEYIALASAAQEAVWLQRLNTDLQNKPNKPLRILEDNQSAICMAKNPQFHGRTKHIEIKYHFIRETVEHGTIELMYCPTEDMVADLLTKGLSKQRFEKLRQMSGLKEMF
ncbi:putative Gag-pol polyprotein [Apostichopus japonicus]|uniref:Putative Gag-pol polyprotein n=1 Tax=Stichopus japonicus TaxID=307972 RepID=A0A2G8KMC7_STIJA|nr:putative Gag-pol polyprotein [Apostichopus japonicus]